MLWEKQSRRSIARRLGRSHTSVSREIRRNKPPQLNRYSPRKSQERANTKRKSRGRKDRLKNNRIRLYVIEHLRKRWSPEQIAGRITLDMEETISHEAIYQYIYYQVHRDGYGLLKPGCIDLRPCLRRRRKRRIRKGMRLTRKVPRFNGVSIETRPRIVDLRTRIGDWETDTVESKDHRPGVNTLLERTSGLYLVTKLLNKGRIATTNALFSRLQP